MWEWARVNCASAAGTIFHIPERSWDVTWPSAPPRSDPCRVRALNRCSGPPKNTRSNGNWYVVTMREKDPFTIFIINTWVFNSQIHSTRLSHWWFSSVIYMAVVEWGCGSIRMHRATMVASIKQIVPTYQFSTWLKYNCDYVFNIWNALNYATLSVIGFHVIMLFAADWVKEEILHLITIK